MKDVVEQLSTYKSVHFNPQNIQTHFVGIPMIVWSIFLLLSTIPIPLFTLIGINFNVAVLFAIGVLVYYYKLHIRIALGLTVFIIPVLITSSIVAQTDAAIAIAIGVFVIGWGFQFWGHKFEKAKPAFVDDLNQLLIGPFFLMAEVYFMCGKERSLLEQIIPIARDKRRAIEAAKKKS